MLFLIITTEFFLSDVGCPTRLLPRQQKEQNSLSNLLFSPAFNLLTLETENQPTTSLNHYYVCMAPNVLLAKLFIPWFFAQIKIIPGGEKMPWRGRVRKESEPKKYQVRVSSAV